MKIVVWGTGYRERLIENYIRDDVEIAAFVDNNKEIQGGGIKRLGTRN